MATKKQKLKVSVFLLLSVGVMVGALLIVSGLRGGHSTPYRVQFDESLLGLNAGGLVVYLGVPVGRVKNITVTADTSNDVETLHSMEQSGPFTAEVQIEVDNSKVTLYPGVKATLVLYSFAAGTMAISLEGGDPNQAPLEPNSIIPTEQSLLGSVSGEASEMIDKINAIAEALQKWFDSGELDQLTDEVHQVLEEGRDILATAQETMQRLETRSQTTLDEVDELARDVQDAAEGVRHAADAFRDASATVTAKIEPLDLASTEQALRDQIDRVVAKLEESAASFQATAEALVYDADNVQHTLHETTRSLNATLDEVKDLTEKLQDDPASLIRGPGRARED